MAVHGAAEPPNGNTAGPSGPRHATGMTSGLVSQLYSWLRKPYCRVTMRLPFCTLPHNDGSCSLSALVRQLAHTVETPAIFDLADTNAAAAATPFFHPTRSTATVEHQLTG